MSPILHPAQTPNAMRASCVLPLLFLLLGGTTLHSAILAEVQELVVFGDSYSDGGRHLDVDPARPDQIWIDELADRLGIPSPRPYIESDPQGRNFAQDGAYAGDQAHVPFTGSDQLEEYFSNLDGVPRAEVLAIIWLGMFDLMGGHDPDETADAVADLVESLLGEGISQVLVPNAVPLGRLPYLAAEPAEWAAKATAFNERLSDNLDTLRNSHPDRVIVSADIHNLFEEIFDHPEAFGLENLTETLQTNASLDPETTLWWDTVSPSEAGHASIAEVAFNAILGEFSDTAEHVTLSLELAGEGAIRMDLRGPPMNGLVIERSTDGVIWSAWRTFVFFDGLESIGVELDGEERLFFRAR